MKRLLLTLLLLAPLLPAQQSIPPGGFPPPPVQTNEIDGFDPAAPGTWGLPMVPGYACIPWPILPPPFPIPQPWLWGL